MATMVPPQKGVEYIFYVGLISQADTKLLQNNPTLAAGDVLVSTDGGATSNLDTLPAVTPASSDMVKVTVSTSEMNGDNVIIVFSDAAGSEWCDLIVNIQTAAQSLDAMDTNIDDIETDTNELQGLISSSKLPAQVKGIDDIDLSATMKTSVNAEVDTALNTAVPASPVANSINERIKTLDDHDLVTKIPGVVTAVGPTKAQMDTAHALLATPAQVNAQVLDVLQTDTFAEPSSVPVATSSLKDKICWLFTLARNKITQTSTTQTLRNDGDSADIGSSTVSDDGVTAIRGEFS